MLIPAVAMMLLSVSSCDSGLQKGSVDDVLAAIPAGTSAETMSWRQVDDIFGLGGEVGDIFGRVCRLSASDPVAYIHTSGGINVLVSAISDVAVAEDATADWERIDLGRDGIAGRVCVTAGGTVIVGGRFAWLVPSETDVKAAVAFVSSILDADKGLPQPVREALKPRTGIAMALSVEDKYITATATENGDEVEIRGELRDSAGAVYDFGEYAQPLLGPVSESPACVAVAVGLRRGALARAITKHVQPRLSVKEKLAYAATFDILRDVCGTLRATVETQNDDAVVRISLPYAAGGAAAASHRLTSMMQRFGLQSELSVKVVGDTLMRLNIALGERPQMFDGFAPMPKIASDKDGNALMTVVVASVSDDAVRFDGAEAVVYQRSFVVTLHGTSLRRLSAVLHGHGVDDTSSDE